MILITGETGTNGWGVVKQLSANGIRTRAMVRKRENVKSLRAAKVEFVHGDFDDAASLDVALVDVSESLSKSKDMLSRSLIFLPRSSLVQRSRQEDFFLFS